MRPMLDITKDIQSLTTSRRRSNEILKQLKKSKRPVVLTVKSKAAAIVQDGIFRVAWPDTDDEVPLRAPAVVE
jgi:hypothetical protein